MFLAHRVDITKALEADTEHVLEITFDCALLRARELRCQDNKHKWVSSMGDPARMSVRKAQYHWGWDWGPILMTAGIWRRVRIEVYSAHITDLWTEIKLSDNRKLAKVTALAEVDAPTGSYGATFALSLHGKEVASAECTVANKIAQTTFDLENPSFWWPHGYGEPTLYQLSISLTDGENELHQVTKRVGIRTAEVIQQSGKYGKSFFFRINGVDVFCGGSCWIPADSILPNITPERYRKWVEMMFNGGQIMTRFGYFSLLVRSR